MNGKFRGLLLSALAVGALTVGALTAFSPEAAAQNTSLQYEKPAGKDLYIRKPVRPYRGSRAVKDPGSSNRYFSDTKQMPIDSLGPAFMRGRGGFYNLPSSREPY